MRFKFTAFLIALNLLVFGLIIYLEKRSSAHVAQAEELSTIVSRELTEADRIVLKAENLPETILEKSGAKWMLTEPVQWAANDFAVNRILNQLQFMEQEASFSVEEIENNGQSLADYGLENPAIQLGISQEDDSFELGIGTITEVGNNLYVLGPNERRVYVVKSDSISSILLDLADLQQREVFDIPVFEVHELSLNIRATASGTAGDLKVRLAKVKERWGFEAPLSADADPTLVSRTINTLASVKALAFLTPSGDTEQDFGLTNPSMRVTLHGNKRRQTLIIGNQSTQSEGVSSSYFARLEGNPTVFTVSAEPFDALLEAQEDLRERNFVDWEDRPLDSVHISQGDRQTRLQKIENGNWQVLESISGTAIEPRRADRKVIESMIETVKQFRAMDFALDAPTSVDLERLGFNDPRRIIELIFEDGERLRLEFAHPTGENDRLYARTDRAEFIYEIERRTTIQALQINALHYRDRTLSVLPGSAYVRSMTLGRSDREEPLIAITRRDDEHDWSRVITSLPEEQREAVTEILDSLRDFRVKRYLRDTFDESAYRLDEEESIPWAYTLEAELVYPGGEHDQLRTARYSFTKRLSGTVQVGGSQEPAAVFEINQSMIEALYAIFEKPDLPPEALESRPIPRPEPIQEIPEPKIDPQE